MTGRVSDMNQTVDSANEVEQKEKPSKKRHLPLLIGVGLCALLLLGFFRSALFPTAEERALNGNKLSGRIEGPEIHLSARLPGAVKSVYVKEGDAVRKGQLLLQLDDQDLAAKSTAANSTVSAVQQVKGNAQRSLNDLRNAERKVQAKSHTLMGKVLGPFSHRKSDEEKLHLEIDQAETQLKAADAQLAQARGTSVVVAATANDLRITSPIDGICTTRSVEPAELVAPGQILLTIVDPNALYLRGFVPEGNVGSIRIGQQARVYLDSAPKQPLNGRVTAIDSQAAFTPENVYFPQDRVKQVFGIKIAIDKPAGLAKPGMPADAEIISAR